MTKSPRPPIRPVYGRIIKKMRKGGSEFFPGAKHNSVKAIASRLGAAHGRQYLTSGEDGGVRVWRVA